jgi:hypothetical protein
VELRAGRDRAPREGEGPAEEGRISVRPRLIRAEAEQLRVDAKKAEAVFEGARLFVSTLRTVAKEVESRFVRKEEEGQSLIERLGDAFREVEGLSQTRAGRLKLLAKKALSLSGDSVGVQADREVSVDGEKIYLG